MNEYSMLTLQEPKQKEQNKSQAAVKEIIEIWTEMNEIENRKTIEKKKSMKQIAGSLHSSIKLTNI